MNSNGRCGVKKLQIKQKMSTYTQSDMASTFYECGYENDNDSFNTHLFGKFHSYYSIGNIGQANSYVDGKAIEDHFDDMQETTLTGNSKPNKFIVQRVIVIQMK